MPLVEFFGTKVDEVERNLDDSHREFFGKASSVSNNKFKVSGFSYNNHFNSMLKAST